MVRWVAKLARSRSCIRNRPFLAMAKGTHWNSLNIVLEDVMGLAQVSELTSCRPNLYKIFAVCMYIILYIHIY